VPAGRRLAPAGGGFVESAERNGLGLAMSGNVLDSHAA